MFLTLRSNGVMSTLVGLVFIVEMWQLTSASWTRTNMAVNAATCTSSDTAYISQAMYNIQSMVCRSFLRLPHISFFNMRLHKLTGIKLASTISGLSTIEGNLGKKRNDLNAADKAKLDIFMSLYGEFDPTSMAAIATARSLITNMACEFIDISITSTRRC